MGMKSKIILRMILYLISINRMFFLIIYSDLAISILKNYFQITGLHYKQFEKITLKIAGLHYKQSSGHYIYN